MTKLVRAADLFASQYNQTDVRTSPMRKGVAVGGPKDKIKLEAPMTWNGRIAKFKEYRDGVRRLSGVHVGHYIWTGEVWRWIVDETDTNPVDEDA